MCKIEKEGQLEKIFCVCDYISYARFKFFRNLSRGMTVDWITWEQYDLWIEGEK